MHSFTSYFRVHRPFLGSGHININDIYSLFLGSSQSREGDQPKRRQRQCNVVSVTIAIGMRHAGGIADGHLVSSRVCVVGQSLKGF